MGTINEKLTYLKQTKKLIKDAIVTKGIQVSDTDTFRSYADKISNIQTGSSEPKVFGIGNFYGIDSINSDLFISGIGTFQTVTKDMLELDSSDIICKLNNTTYTKGNNGLAIGGYGTPYGEATSGPILVSTISENAYYGGGDEQSFVYDGDGNIYYYYIYNFNTSANIVSTSGSGVWLNQINDIYISMINGRTIYESLLDYYFSLT